MSLIQRTVSSLTLDLLSFLWGQLSLPLLCTLSKVTLVDEALRHQPISQGKGLLQSAYQIQVASDPENLRQSAPSVTLWDTGKISSNASLGIRYAGAPLQSHQEVFWRVKLWDGADNSCEWSNLSRWNVAFLNSAEHAPWIMSPKTPVWLACRNQTAPQFRGQLPLKTSSPVVRARLYASGLGYLQVSSAKTSQPLHVAP